MAFTYTGNLTSNLDFVRFHTGDTNAESAFLSDEVITSLVLVEGSQRGAVIAAIEYIITQLSKPDFKADWLSVTHGDARKGYEALLARKRASWGLDVRARITATRAGTYRADGLEGHDGYGITTDTYNHPHGD